MPNKIDQLFISYQPIPDRLLLRIATVGGDELRLWVTRRFVLPLWAALLDVAASDLDVQSQQGAEARNAVLAFQHEKAIAESEFTTTFDSKQEPEARPSPPLLAAEVDVSRRDGARRLHIRDDRGNSVDMAMTPRLAHSLCKLVSDAVAKADWGLKLRLAADTSARDRRRGLN